MRDLKKIFGISGYLLFATILPLSAQNWKLVWQDEFTTAIGPDWVFETGNNNGWGNSELETYTNGANAAVVNGVLEITARKESNGTVTSTRMKTAGRKSWQYGKVEARIKLPLFHGAFPAFWMLGEAIDYGKNWPTCGEIDIMENINSSQNTYGTIHYDDGGWQHIGGAKACDPSQWHINTMVWDKDKVVWYLDGLEYNRYDLTNPKFDEFRAKFFILLNLAYKSNWTEAVEPGATLANFPSTPQVMYVDWVRVYQIDNNIGCGVNFTTIPAKIEAEDYCQMSGITSESTTDFGAGMHVAIIDNKSWMGYSITVPADGKYTVNYRVASSNGGSIQLEELGGSKVYGTVDVPSTSGMDKWKTISQTVDLTAGNHSIGIKALTGGFNLNWIKIENDGVVTMEAEDYDNGGANVSFSDVTPTNEGGKYRTDAVDIESGATGYDVGWISAGEWLQYTLPSEIGGTYDITIPVACPVLKAGQSINIKIDGTSVGKITPTMTGAWSTFKDVTISGVKIAAGGSKMLKLEFAIGDFNIDYIKFTRTSTTSLNGHKSDIDNLVQVYPSPVTDLLNVSTSLGEIDQIDVYTTSGSKVLTIPNGSMVDMRNLNSGIYIVNITIQGKIATKKVIKK